MSLSHNFCPLVWHVSHRLLWQYWCFFRWPPWVRWLHSDNMNTLSVWSCSIKIDEVHYTALIYQNLEIPSFGVPPVWPIIFHQHTDIITWNKVSITRKIFISKIRYLKIYLSAVNIKIQQNCPWVWMRQIFHGCGA